MTREEAIKYIDGLHVVPCEQLKEFCDERNEAIDMAIEALSKADGAENPKCDLISRADALELAIDVETPQGYEQAVFVDDIKALPPADRPTNLKQKFESADRPSGEWVEHKLFEHSWYTCSECNFHGSKEFTYCPNCGADMRGDK